MRQDSRRAFGVAVRPAGLVIIHLVDRLPRLVVARVDELDHAVVPSHASLRNARLLRRCKLLIPIAARLAQFVEFAVKTTAANRANLLICKAKSDLCTGKMGGL